MVKALNKIFNSFNNVSIWRKSNYNSHRIINGKIILKAHSNQTKAFTIYTMDTINQWITQF